MAPVVAVPVAVITSGAVPETRSLTLAAPVVENARLEEPGSDTPTAAVPDAENTSDAVPEAPTGPGVEALPVALTTIAADPEVCAVVVAVPEAPKTRAEVPDGWLVTVPAAVALNVSAAVPEGWFVTDAAPVAAKRSPDVPETWFWTVEVPDAAKTMLAVPEASICVAPAATVGTHDCGASLGGAGRKTSNIYSSAQYRTPETVIESAGAAINRNVETGPSAAMFENFNRISGTGIHDSGIRMFHGMMSINVPPVDAVPRFLIAAVGDPIAAWL